MAARLCDVCGVRPAVVTVRRVVPGGGSRTEHLCEIHAAEARGGGRRRSPFGGGGSLFDDFFKRFFEDASAGPRSIPIGGGGEATSGRRGAEQVDITQFFSDSTSQLLQRAAHQAAEWGSMDLNSEHLHHSALEDEVVQRVLEGVDADPHAIRAQRSRKRSTRAAGRTSLLL